MARNQRKHGIVFIIVSFLVTILMVKGEYDIGSCLIHLIDTRRVELYTHDDNHPWRELMVRVWYPTKAEEKSMIADGQMYPLLLFSHGLGGFNGDSYAALCCACVQAGYIVVTLSHSYACKPIQFPDGRMTTYSSVDIAQSYGSGREMITWQDDIEYVLDQLCVYNDDEGSFLYNKIDVDAVGVFGHSYGGAAAVQMCRKDDRIKVAINLDGPLRGNSATEPFNKPLLFIIGSSLPYTIPLITNPLLTNDITWSYFMHSQEIHRIDALYYAMNGYAHKIVINGIRHTTFSNEIFNQYTAFDNSLMDPSVAHAMISSYIIDFFNMHIQGRIFS